ncbi:hypothetical protein C8Q77DRAFT_110407 [Trametes polyzona]|nr:hypothetical protein C8Q77DRAFT_110407 [Trametes polyzona]
MRCVTSHCTRTLGHRRAPQMGLGVLFLCVSCPPRLSGLSATRLVASSSHHEPDLAPVNRTDGINNTLCAGRSPPYTERLGYAPTIKESLRKAISVVPSFVFFPSRLPVGHADMQQSAKASAAVKPHRTRTLSASRHPNIPGPVRASRLGLARAIAGARGSGMRRAPAMAKLRKGAASGSRSTVSCEPELELGTPGPHDRRRRCSSVVGLGLGLGLDAGPVPWPGVGRPR